MQSSVWKVHVSRVEEYLSEGSFIDDINVEDGESFGWLEEGVSDDTFIEFSIDVLGYFVFVNEDVSYFVCRLDVLDMFYYDLVFGGLTVVDANGHLFIDE